MSHGSITEYQLGDPGVYKRLEAALSLPKGGQKYGGRALNMEME